MVLCALCSCDASISGASCVLCKKVIDSKCHGGTIGDENIICKACANVPINPNEIDDMVVSVFRKFSSESLKEIASSQLLKSIFSGQLYSYRHNIYKAGGSEKSKLNFLNLFLNFLAS
ncbi:uncharacterized protein LOC124808052 [Hydra vulgaris]|uniref:uncharacterized protein LOC124808052 n=1 Tax=Hydra vulgaris TaxID=6087 RepID=UPI0032E9FA9B